MTEQHQELIAQFTRLAIPFSKLSPDEAGQQRFAQFLAGCFQGVEQLAGWDVPEGEVRQDLVDAVKNGLLSAYTDFYQGQASYDVSAAIASLNVILDDAERITLMNTLWGLARDIRPANEAVDLIQGYADGLGLIWDRTANTFTENAWGAVEQTEPVAAIQSGYAKSAGPRHPLSVLLSLLEKKAGALKIEQTHDAGEDTPLVIIYADSPTNAKVRQAISPSLSHLVEHADLKLVMIDGAVGVVDTSSAWCWPETEVNQLLKDRKLGAAEYCHIQLKGAFSCLGVDDAELYRQSAERFAKGDHNAVNDLEPARAKKMAGRMLASMSELGVSFAVLVVSGHLPDLVSERLKELNASFVLLGFPRAVFGGRVF